MRRAALDQLIDLLWPDGDSRDAPQVHYVLDGARDPAIAAMLGAGDGEQACLFSGALTPRLRAAAPYIVRLAAASPLTRALLERGWGNSWGILTVAPPAVTLAQQRLHLKKFLRVATEDGERLLFRFYDPRVLRVYLPSCTAGEFSMLLGPLTQLLAETPSGAGLIAYGQGADGLACAQTTHIAHTGL